MKIILNNEYSIQKIDIGYALVETKLSRGNAKNKTAVPRMISKPVAYYMTVQGCVDRFVREFIDKKSADFEGDLMAYVERLENITKACQQEVMKGVEKIL